MEINSHSPAFFHTIRTVLYSRLPSARDPFRSAQQLRPSRPVRRRPRQFPRQSSVPSPRVKRSPMDQSGQYVQSSSHQRHQRFPSSQLPPPSQLLPGSSYNNRSITLPPINSLPQASSRYAPYPHHSSPVSSSHPSSQLPWPNQSIPREDLVQRPPPSVKQESHSISHREPPEPSGSQSASSRHDPTEDSMSSTSDFVKKLYKYAFVALSGD